MGYTISLLYFPGAAKKQALAAAGYSETSEEDEVNEEPVSGAELKNGDYLIWRNWEWDPVGEDYYRRISTSSPLIVMDLSETTMACGLFFYRDGWSEWSISHFAENGIDNLTATGTLPGGLAGKLETLRRDAARKQAQDDEVDYYFDVPVELFRHLSGFRYDMEHDRAFHVLEAANDSAAPLGKPWR